MIFWYLFLDHASTSINKYSCKNYHTVLCRAVQIESFIKSRGVKQKCTFIIDQMTFKKIYICTYISWMIVINRISLSASSSDWYRCAQEDIIHNTIRPEHRETEVKRCPGQCTQPRLCWLPRLWVFVLQQPVSPVCPGGFCDRFDVWFSSYRDLKYSESPGLGQNYQNTVQCPNDVNTK